MAMVRSGSGVIGFLKEAKIFIIVLRGALSLRMRERDEKRKRVARERERNRSLAPGKL